LDRLEKSKEPTCDATASTLGVFIVDFCSQNKNCRSVGNCALCEELFLLLGVQDILEVMKGFAEWVFLTETDLAAFFLGLQLSQHY